MSSPRSFFQPIVDESEVVDSNALEEIVTQTRLEEEESAGEERQNEKKKKKKKKN